MAFFTLPSFSLRYQGNGRIEDVHLFVKCLYRFWFFKGFWGSCWASCIDFLNSLVLFILVLFFTTLFDWPTALSCDELSCGNMTLVGSMHFPVILGTNHTALAFVLLVSSLISVCYEFIKFVEMYKQQKEVETMLCTIVNIGHTTPVHRIMQFWKRLNARADGREEIPLMGDLPFVGNMSWGEFLDAVCERIQRDRMFGVVAHRDFDSLRAVQAFMVYDNYFIALYQYGVLERGTLRFVDDDVLKLLICSMFDEFNTLNSVGGQVAFVRWQMVKYIIFYTLFYPFRVVFIVTRLLVKNAAMLRSDWGDYMSRDWSGRAKWTFRLYNEVPHILSARMSKGRQKAVEMVDRLQPHSSFSRFLRRTASAIVFATLGLSLLNTSLLISGSICGVPLVWWLSIALAVFAVYVEKEPVQREYNYIPDLKKLIQQLHYSREEWFYSGEAFYNALILDFLKSRFFLIMSDLLRTLFMPLILLGVLCDGTSIMAVVDCVHSESVRVDGLGSVAKGSVFDFKTTSTASGDIGDDNVRDKGLSMFCFDEKCAMSIASFFSVYLGWASKHMMANGGESPTDATEEPSSLLNCFLQNLHQKLSLRKEDEPQASQYTYQTLDDAVNGSCWHPTQWECSTAHEREQLFVSQATTLFPNVMSQYSRPWVTVSSSVIGREGVHSNIAPPHSAFPFFDPLGRKS